MNDKTKPKLDSKIEAEELNDEELQDVNGGPIYIKIEGLKGDIDTTVDKIIESEITTDYKR